MLITDLEMLRQLAAQRHDEFEVMCYTLEAEDELDDTQFDAWVDSIAAPIVATIDCTKCANCCRSLDVYLVEDDARRLADGLLIPLEAVETRYIDHQAAAEVEEWGKLRQRPCAFLKDKLCSVYPHRPESCRLYPTFTPDFRWTLADTIAGTGICPIIYNVLSEVCARVDQGEFPH